MEQTIQIGEKQLQEIQRIAARYGITINECIRKLLDRAIVDVKLEERLTL